MELAIVEIRRQLGNDPALMLALDPETDLAAELVRERLARFEARGCRQVSALDWQAETAAIAEALESRLVERFRRA